MYFRTSNPSAINKAIDCIRQLSGVWEIKIIKYVKGRSNAQNNLYWLWMGIIAQETGNHKDDLHDYFRARYLDYETIIVFGKKIVRLKSTQTLTTTEFTHYLDQIDALMLSTNIKLPKPDDLYFEAMGCK